MFLVAMTLILFQQQMLYLTVFMARKLFLTVLFRLDIAIRLILI